MWAVSPTKSHSCCQYYFAQETDRLYWQLRCSFSRRIHLHLVIGAASYCWLLLNVDDVA